ncbi:MAG: ATP-binding protein [Lachnospiraceae bacterium]|nr:ATP-binding protein [Lachnospiraceae bacterium]
MVLHFIIKNFGKVESADISLDDLVIFVGNNNSGKTMVMQLIYGIRKELKKFQVSISGARHTQLNDQYLIRCDQKWFREVESQVNEYLAENKSRIVEDIFGIPVSCGEIRVEVEDTVNTYFVSSLSGYRNKSIGEEETRVSIDTRQYENGENTRFLEHQVSSAGGLETAVRAALQMVWSIVLSEKNTTDGGQLFLPASRSGLQLRGSRRSLLEFGEEHLLEGKVIQKGDETFYVEKYGTREISLHVASSMIHELTPFIKALSATQQIDWLYCDEVENSLHPLLQREMARWLIRMVNAGMHIIISSHSDTRASRLNNLFMLTQLNRRKPDYKMLSDLELMEIDLLRPDRKAGVYEFRNEGQGRTVVEKKEFISHPLMGYDFQLFGRNLDKLYDEADRITR